MKATYKFITAFVVLAAVAGGGYWAYTKQSGDDLANLSAAAGAKLSDDQVLRLIERVGRFMVLPEGEQPTVVVIRDAAALAEKQSFYRGAKDGDVLIVYASRAIIYDAKDNKLVNVGPIVRNEEPPAPTASGSAQASPGASPSATPAEPEKSIVDVRNGTGTAGLAGSTASDLKKNSWVTIGKVGDAKGAFTKTVIVDLSKGTKPGAVAALKGLLSAEVVTELPKGEAASTADILVIVGK